MLYEKLRERQTASELVFDGKILHLYHDDITLPNGNTLTLPSGSHTHTCPV